MIDMNLLAAKIRFWANDISDFELRVAERGWSVRAMDLDGEDPEAELYSSMLEDEMVRRGLTNLPR